MKLQQICALSVLFSWLIPAAICQEIQRLDPTVDQLVPANAKLERVATGFDK